MLDIASRYIKDKFNKFLLLLVFNYVYYFAR